MKNVTVLTFGSQFNEYVNFPYVYALFKHYYEVNGQQQYNWIDPKYLKQDEDPKEVAQWLQGLDLTYLLASLYIWNYSYTHLVLREYKKLCPYVPVVVGGPHVFPGIQYFHDHPWIDITCNATTYGEVFVTDLLDGKDLKDVSGAVWRTGMNFTPFNIRDFKWAPSPYANSAQLALELSSKYGNLTMQLETSRGCPYKCSFCEWGGGIGTKMSKRSLADVKMDIDAMVAGGVDTIQICDSNYGFWPEDVEITQYLADYKTTIGYPKAIEIYGWSKNNHKHHYDILKIMRDAGFTQHYSVSLQSTKEETLANIRRSDIPAAQRVEFARKIVNELGTQIQFELILALPGDVLDDYYESINMRHEFMDHINFVWWILPNTEAHTTEYREKHGLITAWSETVETEFDKHKPPIWDETRDLWEYVIGSNTLTPTEWLEAFLLDRFYVSAKHDDAVWDQLETRRLELALTPKEFWQRVMKAVPTVTEPEWASMWAEAWPQFLDRIVPNGVTKNFYVVHIQDKPWKFPDLPLVFYRTAMSEILQRVGDE